MNLFSPAMNKFFIANVFPVNNVSLRGFVNVYGILDPLSHLCHSHCSVNLLTFTGLLLTFISAMER